MRVVTGFDLGTQAGWCSVDETGIPLEGGIIEAGSGEDKWNPITPDRVSRVVPAMRRIIAQERPEFIAFEMVQHGKGAGPVFIYGQQALLLSVAEMFRIPVIGLTISEVKQTATGSGNASKEEMWEAVWPPYRQRMTEWASRLTGSRTKRYTDRMVEARRENICDAYWAAVGLHQAATEGT